MKKCDKALILLLIIYSFNAILLVILVPPWQNADEPTHFEQVVIFSHHFGEQLSLSQRRDIGIERKIIQDMASNKFWEIMGYKTPHPLPDSFANTPFISGVPSQRFKPTTYYRIAGLVLKLLRSDNVTTSLYCLRMFSMLWGLIAVIVIYKISVVLSNNRCDALTVTCMCATLPQFLTVTTSVNNDSMFLPLFYGLLLQMSGKFDKKTLFKKFFFVLPLFILLITTDRAAILFLLIFAIYLFLQFPSSGIRLCIYGIGMLLTGAMVILPVLSWLGPNLTVSLVDKITSWYLQIGLSTGRLSLSAPNWWENVRVWYDSFFFAAGWMQFYFPKWIRILLRMLVILPIIGLLANVIPYRKSHNSENRTWRYFVISNAMAFLILLILSLLTYGTRGSYIQGRFFLPFLPFLAQMTFQGLSRLTTICGLSRSQLRVITVSGSFLLFVCAVTQVLFPAFLK